MIRKMLNEHKFDRVYVFWDGIFSGRLRYDIYKDYKSNRDKDFYKEQPPSELDLYLQKERVISYCEELFIRQYRDEIVEADDSIAYYVKNMSDDEKVVIMSNDRDLCQLINERVSVYVINLKKIVTEENYLVDFDHHPSNLKLIKIMEKTLTLEYIFSKIEDIQKERKNRLKTLDNILNKVTKGSQKEMIYEVNEKIIDLKNPLLTEESKTDLDNLFSAPIDPEGRENKNVINMMIEDGLMWAIPGGRDGYINFLQPFLSIIKKEKTYYKKENY
jgi:hypothetical protein